LKNPCSPVSCSCCGLLEAGRARRCVSWPLRLAGPGSRRDGLAARQRDVSAVPDEQSGRWFGGLSEQPSDPVGSSDRHRAHGRRAHLALTLSAPCSSTASLESTTRRLPIRLPAQAPRTALAGGVPSTSNNRRGGRAARTRACPLRRANEESSRPTRDQPDRSAWDEPRWRSSPCFALSRSVKSGPATVQPGADRRAEGSRAMTPDED